MLPFQTENGKSKPRQISLLRLPFAYRANGSLSFVHLLTKKQNKETYIYVYIYIYTGNITNGKRNSKLPFVC
jgi:hypothetical protein